MVKAQLASNSSKERGKRRGERERVAQAHDGALRLQASIGNAAFSSLVSTPGEGGSLPSGLRRRMEGRLGVDLQDVRIHDTAAAQAQAARLGAKAFTIGNHIVFNQGRYAPETAAGRHLVAHELAHVVQQRRGGTAEPTIDGSGALEAAAGRAADATTSGSGPVRIGGGSAVGVAAEPDDDDRPWYEKVTNIATSASDRLMTVVADPEAAYKEARGRVGAVVSDIKETASGLAEGYHELPSANEVAAGALKKLSDTVGRDSEAGAALGTASDIIGAAVKLDEEPKQAFYEKLLEGHPIDAVEAWQKGMDDGLKNLKKEVWKGVEDYEDGKFGNPAGLSFYPDPLVGAAITGIDQLSGGKASQFVRQGQGGLIKSIYTMGEGLMNIGVHPVRTVEGLNKVAEMASPLPSSDTIVNFARFTSDLVDPDVSIGDALDNYNKAETEKQQRRSKEAMAMVKALGENYIDAWEKGRYGEIPGLLLGDIGSFFIGGGEANAATKTAAATGRLGETGNLLGKLGETSKVLGELGDLGKTGELGDLGKLGELGDLGKAGDLGKTGELGDLGKLGDLDDLGKAGDLTKTAEAAADLGKTAPATQAPSLLDQILDDLSRSPSREPPSRPPLSGEPSKPIPVDEVFPDLGNPRGEPIIETVPSGAGPAGPARGGVPGAKPAPATAPSSAAREAAEGAAKEGELPPLLEEIAEETRKDQLWDELLGNEPKAAPPEPTAPIPVPDEFLPKPTGAAESAAAEGKALEPAAAEGKALEPAAAEASAAPVGKESVPAGKPLPPAPLGESMIKPGERSGLNVDVAVQRHADIRDFREQSGSAVQSAHMIPTSAAKDLVNYSRSEALTVLMPREVHAAFDNGWKAWAREQVAQGRTTVTVQEFLEVLDQSAAAVPQLRGRTADTMSWLFQIEAYQTLGLNPHDLLRLPYSK